jgi:hypothetical protein
MFATILCMNSGFSSVPANMPKNANAARLAISHAVHSLINLYICTLMAPGGWAYIRIKIGKKFNDMKQTKDTVQQEMSCWQKIYPIRSLKLSSMWSLLKNKKLRESLETQIPSENYEIEEKNDPRGIHSITWVSEEDLSFQTNTKGSTLI